MRLSMVIPVYEDRGELRHQRERLEGAAETIVVDASRRDPVVPHDLPARGKLLRSGVANRAHQQNLGAEAATGDTLLFLHADTVLPEGAGERIAEALRDPVVVGGGFERRFDSASRVLDRTCRLAAWRSRKVGWFLGDQGIFVRRGVFERLGGFRELRAFEDYDLCRRLKRCGELRCLTPPVVSSARRFERDGPVRRSLKDLALTVVYVAIGARFFRAGASAEIIFACGSRTE